MIGSRGGFVRGVCRAALRRPADYLAKRFLSHALLDPYSAYNHPYAAMRRQALDETVTYIKRHMKTAVIKNDVFDVLEYALQQAPSGGLILEFGVRTGSTINFLSARRRNETVYGFDSFEGLPEAWGGFIGGKGTFAQAALPRVNGNVQLVKGWFSDTLPKFAAAYDEPVSFMHIDSDLYSSAKTIFDCLAEKIRPGTVIVFNEYFNYPNWQEHEFKAFREFREKFDVRYEYLCWGYYEAAVKILENHAAE